MANYTISKTITYTDSSSGVSFTIASTKSKKATHAYRQVMSAASGIQRNIFEVGTDPSYTKIHALHLENVSEVDAYLIISSGGEVVYSLLPYGRTYELFNVNFWNQDSATDPDTIDFIQIEGIGGTCKVKIDAALS